MCVLWHVIVGLASQRLDNASSLKVTHQLHDERNKAERYQAELESLQSTTGGVPAVVTVKDRDGELEIERLVSENSALKYMLDSGASYDARYLPGGSAKAKADMEKMQYLLADKDRQVRQLIYSLGQLESQSQANSRSGVLGPDRCSGALYNSTLAIVYDKAQSTLKLLDDQRVGGGYKLGPRERSPSPTRPSKVGSERVRTSLLDLVASLHALLSDGGGHGSGDGDGYGSGGRPKSAHAVSRPTVVSISGREEQADLIDGGALMRGQLDDRGSTRLRSVTPDRDDLYGRSRSISTELSRGRSPGRTPSPSPTPPPRMWGYHAQNLHLNPARHRGRVSDELEVPPLAESISTRQDNRHWLF